MSANEERTQERLKVDLRELVDPNNRGIPQQRVAQFYLALESMSVRLRPSLPDGTILLTPTLCHLERIRRIS